MNYLIDLNLEELTYICNRIPQKEIRGYFHKNPEEFSKIRPGFRPGSLSLEESVDLLCANIVKPFVSSFIENWIKIWMAQIDDYKDHLVAEGMNYEGALLRTLTQSVFSDYIDLYFKFCEKRYPLDYISLMKAALPLLTHKDNVDISPAEKTTYEQIEAENSSLRQLLEARNIEAAKLFDEIEAEKIAHQLALSAEEAVESECNLLRNELDNAKANIASNSSEMQALQDELGRLRQLSTFYDSELPHSNSDEYEYTSICRVSVDDYSGQLWLSRLADITRDGIIRFEKQEDIPHYFGNRDRLFCKDGPDVVGTIGVWYWSAEPNRNDPEKDYVKSEYDFYTKPIEVVEFVDCNSIDELAQKLTANSLSFTSGMRPFFAIHDSEYSLKGFLFNESSFDLLNGKYYLKQNTYTCPIFTIPNDNIINLLGIRVYRFMTLGMPQSVYRIRTPHSVVKQTIISRATMSVIRRQGLTKKEAQHCQAFLHSLPEVTLVQEIADKYCCTEDNARKYIEEFIVQAATYLNGTDFDLSVITEALRRDPELVAKCKELLTDEWKSEQEDLIRKADEELSQVEKQRIEHAKRVEILSREYEAFEEKLNSVQAEIDSKLALANAVEEKVTERITNARQNAADFICDMAFSIGSNLSFQARSITADNDISFIRRSFNSAYGEPITDVASFNEELAENLEICGYEPQISLEMAQLICFAISNRMPIVINENAESISNCIAAMFDEGGAYVTTLPIGQSSARLCNSISRSACKPHNVFEISGIFDGYSLNAFNEAQQFLSAAWGEKVVLILTLSGISVDMLPKSVWNKAVFIDGDIGLERCVSNVLNSFTCDFQFEKKLDTSAIKVQSKSIRCFQGLVSNKALLIFAKYMADFDETIVSSIMLRLQIAVAAQSSKNGSTLIEAFQKADISAEANALIAKYL